MKKNEVLIFSIALEGYASLFQSCISTQREYSEKQNFDYLLIDKAARKLQPFEAAWLKLFLLRSALKGDYEWIAFLDADCEVRNHAPSFVAELEKYREKSLFMAHGFSERINSGVIFLRNTEDSRKYLEEVINNGDKKVPDEDKALYENGHMIHYGKNNPAVQIIDFEKWNNNRAFNKRSYIQHYSGGRLREEFLKRFSTNELRKEPLNRFQSIKNIFRRKDPLPTMKEIQNLIPFYNKRYPDIFKI